MPKAPVQTIRFDDVKFLPRFEHGDVCQVAAVCGVEKGGELGAGFARLTKAKIPWATKYDEMLLLVEGSLKVHAGGKVHELRPKDTMWIPNGTDLVYEADDALVYYAIHPVNWQT